jgi:GAF domain-containing protein
MQDNEIFLARGKEFIASSSDASKTVRDLVRVAAEAVGSNMGALYLLDETRTVLKPAVIVNLPDAYVEGVGDVRLGTQCCGRAAFHKLPWYVDDIWNEPLFPLKTREMAQSTGVRAGFSVPVIVNRDACIGALSAHFPEPHVPSRYEIHRQNLFAQLIAMALVPESPQFMGQISSTDARRVSEEDPRKRSTAD